MDALRDTIERRVNRESTARIVQFGNDDARGLGVEAEFWPENDGPWDVLRIRVQV